MFSLDVIFGLPWPSVVNLPANLDAFIVYLSAGFVFRSHLRDPLLEAPPIPGSPFGDPPKVAFWRSPKRRRLMPPRDEIVRAGQGPPYAIRQLPGSKLNRRNRSGAELLAACRQALVP